MIEKLTPWSSHEDIALLVSEVESLVGVGETSLEEDESVQELLDSLQYKVAYWASEMKIGLNRRHEQQEFIIVYDLYRRLVRAIVLDAALRKYRQSGDSDKTKIEVRTKFLLAKARLLAAGYKRRREMSKAERAKEKAAHNPVIRSMAELALKGVAGGTATLTFARYIQENQDSFTQAQVLLAKGGLIGFAGFLSLVGVRAMSGTLKRNGPRQLGGYVGSRFNATLKDFKRLTEAERNELALFGPLDDIDDEYAARDLLETKREISSRMFDFTVETEEDIEPMIDAVMAIFERSIFNTFNINLEAPWFRQMLDSSAYEADPVVTAKIPTT